MVDTLYFKPFLCGNASRECGRSGIHMVCGGKEARRPLAALIKGVAGAVVRPLPHLLLFNGSIHPKRAHGCDLLHEYRRRVSSVVER